MGVDLEGVGATEGEGPGVNDIHQVTDRRPDDVAREQETKTSSPPSRPAGPTLCALSSQGSLSGLLGTLLSLLLVVPAVQAQTPTPRTKGSPVRLTASSALRARVWDLTQPTWNKTAG